jgi:diphosphomevalonate decarboxylase
VTVVARAHPSLALVKYWGKTDGGTNLPATPNLAVSLAAFSSVTRVRFSDTGEDRIIVDGEQQPPDRFRSVLGTIRTRAGRDPAGTDGRLTIDSTNDFPTAAGLASSSSGLAALTIALDALFATHLDQRELSAIARQGSGSAARAVYGGFTVWRAGSENAEQLAPESHWPDLRVLIVVVRSGRKSVSSRDGMDRSRETSPFYDAWVASSPRLFERARDAVLDRKLADLGPAMRQSYLRMFSTMFSSDPPLIYWVPETLQIIRTCESLRADGLDVWETMDAGPQVKLIVDRRAVEPVTAAVLDAVPGARVIESAVGADPSVAVGEE